MLVNKLFTYLTCAYKVNIYHISKSKRYFNVNLSTFYFHMKKKIFADFEISISAPLSQIKCHTLFTLTWNLWLKHSHKKKHSLETWARLLFMLLQDFFASARFQRVHEKGFLPKSAVHYLYHLKLNNTIGQRKTTNTEKHFSP